MAEQENAAAGSSAARRTRNSKVGVVVSDRMAKTAVVAIERMVSHPTYKRIVRRTSKFLAHDENNDAHVGDQVEIVETRPTSKRKRWRVARIIRRAPGKVAAGELESSDNGEAGA